MTEQKIEEAKEGEEKNKNEKEEREETPLQGEDESRRSSPP